MKDQRETDELGCMEAQHSGSLGLRMELDGTKRAMNQRGRSGAGKALAEVCHSRRGFDLARGYCS